MSEQTTPPRCPSCGAALYRPTYIDGPAGALIACQHCREAFTIKDVFFTPDCPECSGPMSYISMGGHKAFVCLKCERIGDGKPIPYADRPPVPCPACAGKGIVGVVSNLDNSISVQLSCLVCRGSGNVPPDLAAAWVAAGQRSGGGEG